MCSVVDGAGRSGYTGTAVIDDLRCDAAMPTPRKKTVKKKKRAVGTTGGLIRLNFLCRPGDQEHLDAIIAATALGSESQAVRFAIKRAFDRVTAKPPARSLEKQPQKRGKRGEHADAHPKVLWLADEDFDRLERVAVLSGAASTSQALRDILRIEARRLT